MQHASVVNMKKLDFLGIQRGNPAEIALVSCPFGSSDRSGSRPVSPKWVEAGATDEQNDSDHCKDDNVAEVSVPIPDVIAAHGCSPS